MKQNNKYLVNINSHFFQNISNVMIMFTQVNGKITFINQKGCKLLGYKEKEIINNNLFDKYISGKNKKELKTRFKEIVKHKKEIIISDNISIKSKDEEEKNILIHYTGFSYEHNIPKGVILAGDDRTNMINTEKELLESKKYFQKLFNLTDDPIVIVDKKGYFLDINESVELTTGYKKSELLGKNFLETNIITEKSKSVLLENLKKRMMGEDILPYEIHVLTKEGRQIPCEVAGIKIEYNNNSADMVAFRNISQRKKAIDALRESEEKYHTLFNNIADPIFIFDKKNYNFIDCNNTVKSVYGYSKEELLKMTPFDLHIPKETKKVKKNINLKNIDKPFTYTHIKKNGELMHVEILTNEIKYQGTPAYISIARNITERKNAEEKFSKAFNSSVILMSISSIEDGQYEEINEAFTKITGFTRKEAIGKTSIELGLISKNERANLIKKLMEKGQVKNTELKLTKKNGKTIYCIFNIEIIQIGNKNKLLSIAQDITPRKKAEEKLIQSHERLRNTLEGTVQTLAITVEKRDPYTAGHQKRVSQLACAIAKELSLPPRKIEGIRIAGMLHDIGKINVPAEILSNPAQLTDIEMGIIESHPRIGFDILKNIAFPQPVAKIVLQHHERLDGSGYPQKLKEKKIMLEARILSVADVVEAMISHRPYRPSRGLDEALREISQNKGILYDTDVVNACLRLFKEKNFRFEQR